MADSPWVSVPRQEFLAGAALSETDLLPEPIAQFRKWLEDAKAANIKGLDEMTLATATREGRPSARIVLLKAIDDQGLIFATNYSSRKGREIELNPWGALCIWWHPLEPQVRWEGRIEKVSREISDEYFQSRPREAQIGAWASKQSSILGTRQQLESKVEELTQKYNGTAEIPRPDNWGAYRVIPQRVEFWQGRKSRLHDRLAYSLEGGVWAVERLSP